MARNTKPDTIAAYMAAAKADPARALIVARANTNTPTLARFVRRMAGTFYRAAPWNRSEGRHERGAALQVAAIARRASAPCDYPHEWNLRTYAGPVPHGGGGWHGRHIPGALIVWSGRADMTQRAALLDVVTDVLIGLATFEGADGRAWLPAWSIHGIGATFSDPPEWTAAAVELAWAQDAAAEQIASHHHPYRFGPAARHGRALAIDVLAAQWTREAAEPTRAPLSRARRVAAVARLTRRAPVDPYGTDEHAEPLRDYGARHVDAAGHWTDADGTDAWQTFQTPQDEQAEADDGAAGRGGADRMADAARAPKAAPEIAEDQEFGSEIRARHAAADRQKKTPPEEGAPQDAAAALAAEAPDTVDAVGSLFEGGGPDVSRPGTDRRKYESITID